MYWRDFKDIISALGLILVFIMIIGLPIAVFGYYYKKNRCEIAAQSFESFEYKLGLCMVKYNGKMIPIENIKIGKE